MTVLANSGNSGPGTARQALGRLRAWWLAEWLAVLPASARRWLPGATGAKILIRPAGDGFLLEAMRGGRLAQSLTVPAGGLPAGVLESFPTGRLKSVPVWLCLPASLFFIRSFDIPAEARAMAEQLCATEMQRKTPFRPDAVHSGYFLEDLPGTRKARIHQAIIRRDLAGAETLRLGLGIAEIDTLCIDSPQAQIGAIAIALRPQPVRRRNPGAIAAALGLLAALLAASACGAAAWRGQAQLDGLEREIAIVRPKAAAVRALADRLSREQTGMALALAQKSSTPPFAEAIEEVTRLLPNDAWLTDIRLSEGRPGEHLVSVNGFAPAAASLIGVFDASQLFSDSTLTAPITPDPQENRERFALQTRLRRSAATGAP